MKYTYKIIIVIVVSFSLCCAYGYFVKIGFAKYNFHVNTQFTQIFNTKTNKPLDIVFIGSSRAHMHINPQIIDSICKTKSYNMGQSGASIFEFYYVFKSYLVNNPPPKFLFLTLDLPSFKLHDQTHYYPVLINYTQNPVIEDMLNERGYNALLYKCLPFIFLKDLDDNAKGYAIKGYQGITDIPTADFQSQGFLSNSDDVITEPVHNKITYYKVEKNSLPYLNGLIKLCNEKNIKLIFNYSPEYDFHSQNACVNSKAIFAFITNLAKANKAPFLRGDSLALCKNRAYFANVLHLNKTGARVYSTVLAQQLVPLLK